jgi:hypothetical protein
MTSLGGKLTALACHLTKRVNKAEELIHLSNNIDRILTDKPLAGKAGWKNDIFIFHQISLENKTNCNFWGKSTFT